MSSSDEDMMRRAISLARVQHGRTGANPAVGCVIMGADGRRISEGATGDGGRPHAEQLALSNLAGKLPAGSTAYVTLEPCRERSTGEAACSSRLIDAGIARVVVAVMDRHPKGAGGKAAIEAAGIAIETGFLEDEAAFLYQDFFAALD